MSSPRILVVDDEADLRELLEITFIRMGLDVDTTPTLNAARDCLASRDYALVLVDMRLPDGLGIELVQELGTSGRNIPVAVITAFGSAENAVAALKAGAFDYLSKPVRLDQLRLMVQSALRLQSGSDEETAAVNTGLRLLGDSPVMQEVRSQVARLARSMAPVAISGESGTGKELAARDIHAQSVRADQPFVAVNCGAIPETLMEAEFFGYRKGAFTGAADDRIGFFQAANGGTLMLDEVADLPLAMQVKLLRAIQERRVRRVGATNEEVVDVRLISATHRDLAEWVEQGRFRQDLYYRLNVIELHLPPLRERKSDIGLLAQAILDRLAGAGKASLGAEALQILEAHAFPGNVRELENILERALAFASGAVIAPVDLALKDGVRIPSAHEQAAAAPAEFTPPPSPAAVGPIPADPAANPMANPVTNPVTNPVANPTAPPPMADAELPPCLPDYLETVERDIICRALARTQFNRTQAAELLGISFRQLRYRMQRLAIHDPE